MLFMCMPPQMRVVRTIGVTYHVASSRMSTNVWCFSFSLWIAVVVSQSWQKVNSINNKLKFWMINNTQHIILCVSNYTFEVKYPGYRILAHVKPWTFSCSLLIHHWSPLTWSHSPFHHLHWSPNYDNESAFKWYKYFVDDLKLVMI